MIDVTSDRTPYDRPELIEDCVDNGTAVSDMETLFSRMPTERYVNVLKKLLIEDCEPDKLAQEMGVTKANLYNIKRRAMSQLTRIALKDINEYGK